MRYKLGIIAPSWNTMMEYGRGARRRAAFPRALMA